MTNAPDFRSDPSESPEGRGIAYGRSAAFWKSLPDGVRAEVSQEATLTVGSIEEYPLFVRDQVTKTVVEDAELIGFWVAWHKAGGFGGLEAGGWHRATIYRKIRRFRARFGTHPDEHRFEWIKLDLRRAWTEELEEALSISVSPDPN
ncbi:MAG: hypothetical protein ABSB68_07155 [Acidimicrobiales bacterium]|jgi:hypothetical protein